VLDKSFIGGRIGVSNQGETEVALEGGFMTKVISQATQATPAPKVVKVTKKFVAMLDELKDVRAIANSANKRVDELRKEIFGVVGEQAQTLIHNGVEVAVIAEQSKEAVNMELLKTKFPEVYEACLETKKQYPIRSVTRQAK
jgi:hypothetical protein